MKLVLFLLILLTLLVCIYLGFLSYTAQPPQPGLVNGKLRPCSSKPNCVSSDAEGERYIAPIGFSTKTQDEIWREVSNAITEAGGKIKLHQDDYLWAEYQSRLFRFVDDLEIRLDRRDNRLHIRSGSRSGTSDLGVNRKRIEALRSALKQ